MISKNHLKILVIILWIFTSKIYADEIIIAADDWSPISCSPDSENPGILIEIADSIFSQNNDTIVYLQIPWKRAITMARQGKINGIVGAFYGDAPDFIFPENEQIILTNAFYVCQDNDWNFRGKKSLESVRLGYINGYDYGEFVNNYIKNASNNNVLMISGKSNLTSRLMSLLTANRVDVIVETNLVFLYRAEQLGQSSLFRFAGNASEPMKTFIAFSPNDPKSKKYAQILSDGMITIQNNGIYDKILKKYKLTLPESISIKTHQ